MGRRRAEMGAPKQKWTSEEEEALRRGVLKHGPGKWRTIQKDPEFSPVLSSRSNIDLKVQPLTLPLRHRRLPCAGGSCGPLRARCIARFCLAEFPRGSVRDALCRLRLISCMMLLLAVCVGSLELYSRGHFW